MRPKSHFRNISLRHSVHAIIACCAAQACAQTAGSSYTFQSLHPDFLTRILPSYAQYVPAISPATYSPNDFISEFLCPNGKQVKVVVKSPVTTSEYNVPPIGAKQAVYDYLNNALYVAGQPRTKTVIRFPKNTYNFNFPLYSNCDSHYVHWQLPSGATDLVIDGQGLTVNFSDLGLGLNLPNVNRVTFKNFTFAWPKLKIATIGTIAAVGGNGTTGYTCDVKLDAAQAANLPKMLAAMTSWDRINNHWDLVNIDDDVSYGDGVTSGIALQAGRILKGIPSYGVLFKVGESVLLRHYDFAAAITASGQDVTFDHVTLKNVIGSGFIFNEGRGFHVTHSALTRMANHPISGEGNAFMVNTGVSGDVVIDNSSFSYQGDDAFDMNTQIVRFTPDVPGNNTPMASYQFASGSNSNQLPWPAYENAQSGDTVALFDSALAFQGVATVLSVNTPAGSGTSHLALDQNIDPTLGNAGFIAGDVTNGAGARYVISNNSFRFNRARALLLQTPFGWVNNNRFVGQTLKSVYVLASQYWGEGPGAQELVISNKTFERLGHRQDFLPLDIMAEASDFPNNEDEITGTASAVPSVNQDIVVAGNTFTSDQITVAVNVSSANNVIVSNNSFDLASELMPREANQYPIAVHDASNIFCAKNVFSGRWLGAASCANSRLLELLSPPPEVTAFPPAACGIEATVSGLTELP